MPESEIRLYKFQLDPGRIIDAWRLASGLHQETKCRDLRLLLILFPICEQQMLKLRKQFRIKVVQTLQNIIDEAL